MRRLVAVVFVGVAASCATPVEEKQFNTDDYATTYLFPEVKVVGDDKVEKTKKTTQPRKQQQASLFSPCSDISTGDLRRDISLKLECITEQVRYR